MNQLATQPLIENMLKRVALTSKLNATNSQTRIAQELLETLSILHVRIAQTCCGCHCNQCDKKCAIVSSAIPEEQRVINSFVNPCHTNRLIARRDGYCL